MLAPAQSIGNPAMANTAQIIYEAVCKLPDGLAVEALHYIEYLRQRADEHDVSLDLMRAQAASMDHTWSNPDDEVWNDVPTR
jgi:hypothetical protein